MSASGDIKGLLSMLLDGAQMSDDDYIQNTCGSCVFCYFSYVESFHQKPVDLDDMVDGLLYIGARNRMMRRKNGVGSN